MSADILPFPASVSDQRRLRKAFAELDAALRQQREAVAAWRASLMDLRDEAQRLGHGVQTFAESLEELDAKTRVLNGEARRLGTWADGVILRRT